MKIALFGANQAQFGKVYTEEVLKKLRKRGELSERINKKNIDEHIEFLSDCEIGFATWGMPKFTKEEIEKYMPKLKILFYSAGTVQYFARPFLDCGVRVFSAFAANAVPVAEYTFSQIVLATKGFFQGAKRYKIALPSSFAFTNSCPGNYKAKVGLIGLGAIGSTVAERLKELDVAVLAYDPFVSEEKADKYGVSLVDLESLFKECDVISNHLANKKELRNVLTDKHFKLMKKHSTFINTGRGAQVNEWALAKNLLLHPSRTAVLDVIKSEYFPYVSPLFWCHNAILTPHIAGSTGNEPQRMAQYMIEQLDNYLENKQMQYEVKKEMLETMA